MTRQQRNETKLPDKLTEYATKWKVEEENGKDKATKSYWKESLKYFLLLQLNCVIQNFIMSWYEHVRRIAAATPPHMTYEKLCTTKTRNNFRI